jgi:hypothetical protein
LTEDELYDKIVKAVEAHNLSKEPPTTSSGESSEKTQENTEATASSSGESQKSLDERVAL